MVDLKQGKSYGTKIDAAIKNVIDTLERIGMGLGDQVYAVRNMCYECPEEDDHCSINCEKKNKRYVEKVTISKVGINIMQDKDPAIVFTDDEGNDYPIKDLGVRLFTDREEAINVL